MSLRSTNTCCRVWPDSGLTWSAWGGGIGTRGPGETQIETDRRLINRRIQHLKADLEKVRGQRALHRKRRRSQDIPVAALVGYTNAGKSTLFNALTTAGVMESSALFATLDPVTRRVRLPNGQNVLMSDTVGFIHKLPPTVVAAFHATLEELHDADILLHVVDITHKNMRQHIAVVEDILSDLGLQGKPDLLVLNKADLLPDDSALLNNEGDDGEGIMVSAATRQGLDELLVHVDRLLNQVMVMPVG